MATHIQLNAAQEASSWDKPLLDDFSSASATASIGTEWRPSPVSGNNGRSTMDLSFEKGALSAKGTIRPGNPFQGPGRISILLPLDAQGKEFDVSHWDGVRITLRRTGAPLLLRLVCNEIANGDYFAKELPASTEMQTYDLPWSSLGQVMSPQQVWKGKRVTGIELVAYSWLTQEFNFEVGRIEFYEN
jgi:hypothetical protein